METNRLYEDGPMEYVSNKEMKELLKSKSKAQRSGKSTKKKAANHWIEIRQRIAIFPDNCLAQYEELGELHRIEMVLQCPVCRAYTYVDGSIWYKYCPHCSAEMAYWEDETDGQETPV